MREIGIHFIICLSDPEKSDQIARGVLCQTFTKSYQITNNISEILVPKYWQNLFIK